MRVDLIGVGKSYGLVRALDGVSLSFPAGGRVALIGPNGSGKTTLIRAILGLVGCTGQVLLDGKPPGPASAARVAYVPQIAPLTSAPVGELCSALASIRGLSLPRVLEIAALLGVDLADRSVWRRPFRALSGGTRQKALLALALASDASLFVLDEPTASLDASARSAFFALYEEVAADATLVLCSHRLEELRRLAADAVMLDEGRVAYSGPLAATLGSIGA